MMYNLNIFGEEIKVRESDHYSKPRKGAKYPRNNWITETQLEEIIRSAFRNGLTEWRNRCEVGVMFKNYTGRTFGLLVELKGSTLSIITVIDSRKSHHDIFSRDKTMKTIFLSDYVLQKHTPEQREEKRLENLADNIKIVQVVKNKARPGLKIKRKAK